MKNIINYFVKSVLIFLYGTFFWGTCSAVDIQLASDFPGVFATSSTSIRFNLTKEDLAVYRDFLRFSIDVDGVELKSWRASIQPIEQYVPIFGRAKKLYTESFNVEIGLRFDKNLSEKDFKNSNLCVACLVLDRDGKNKVCNVVLPLQESILEEKHSESNKLETNLNSEDFKAFSTQDTVVNSISVQKNRKLYMADSENEIFEKIDNVFAQILESFKSFLDSDVFFKIYLFLCLIVFLIMFCWYFFSWAVNDFKKFFIFLWAFANFYYLRTFVSELSILVSLAVVSLVVSIYCLKQNFKPETFGQKFKILIGTILAMTVLPLLVKACLINDLYWMRYFFLK